MVRSDAETGQRTTMTPAPAYLIGAERVLNAFGYWPSFHDASLCEFVHAPEGAGSIELALHVFEMTCELDDAGYFRLKKHHLVRFRFDGISGAAFGRIIAENVLFELGFSRDPAPGGRFKVTLDSAMGSDCGGHFYATAGQVVEVTPYAASETDATA